MSEWPQAQFLTAPAGQPMQMPPGYVMCMVPVMMGPGQGVAPVQPTLFAPPAQGPPEATTGGAQCVWQLPAGSVACAQPGVAMLQGQPGVAMLQGQPGVAMLQGQPGVAMLQGQPVLFSVAPQASQDVTSAAAATPAGQGAPLAPAAPNAPALPTMFVPIEPAPCRNHRASRGARRGHQELFLPLPHLDGGGLGADSADTLVSSPPYSPDGGGGFHFDDPGISNEDAAGKDEQEASPRQKELPTLLGRLPHLRPPRADSLKASSLATLNALNMEIGERAMRMMTSQHDRGKGPTGPGGKMSRLEEAMLSLRQEAANKLLRMGIQESSPPAAEAPQERHEAHRPRQPAMPESAEGPKRPEHGEDLAASGPPSQQRPAEGGLLPARPASREGAVDACAQGGKESESSVAQDRDAELSLQSSDRQAAPSSPRPLRKPEELGAAAAAAAAAGAAAEQRGGDDIQRQLPPWWRGKTRPAPVGGASARPSGDLPSGTPSTASTARCSEPAPVPDDAKAAREAPAGVEQQPGTQRGGLFGAPEPQHEMHGESAPVGGSLSEIRESNAQGHETGSAAARQKLGFDDAKVKKATRIVNRAIPRTGDPIAAPVAAGSLQRGREGSAVAAAGEAERSCEALRTKAFAAREVLDDGAKVGRPASGMHCGRETVREDAEEDGQGPSRTKIRPGELEAVEPASTTSGGNPSAASSSVSTPQARAPERADFSAHQDAIHSLHKLLEGEADREVYRGPFAATSTANREEEIRRVVQGLLNKACPDNSARLAGVLAHGVAPQSSEELELIIGVLTKNAVAEPHYADTYADLVFSLISKIPEFPPPDGGKPVTLKTALLNIVQIEYESIPATMDSSMSEVEWQEKKARCLAIMQFIGKLYLRRLLPAKVIVSIVEERLRCRRLDGRQPEEHMVECVCELLIAIGRALESVPIGRDALARVCSRMRELVEQTHGDGIPVYSKRIRFVMQGVIDARAAGWTLKTFKEVARTKQEVRLEQERELFMREARRGQHTFGRAARR